jgi:general nucleoside transport system permease protein
MIEFLTTWFGSIPTFAVPLLLTSTGLIVSERAGVLNLGAEGYMTCGAMAGAVAVLTTGSLAMGVAAGILAGFLLALLFGIAVVVFRADQILAGLAAVALGAGAAGVIGRDYVHQTFVGFPPIELGPIAAIPLLGSLLFKQDILVYCALALTVAAWWLLTRTHLGLRLRAVGEDPATADAAGVDIQLHQLLAVAICGAMAGLGGAYLSLAGSEVWVEGMVSGRGWIALALVIFARWHPLRAVLGALLFGGMEALIPRLLAVGVDAPIYLLAMLPYVLTIAVLAAVSFSRSKRTAEPKDLGRVYVRQDRR